MRRKGISKTRASAGLTNSREKHAALYSLLRWNQAPEAEKTASVPPACMDDGLLPKDAYITISIFPPPSSVMVTGGVLRGGAGPKNPPPITTPDNLVNVRAPSQPEAALPSSSSRIGRIAQLASRRILSRPLPAEHPSPNNRPSCPGKVRTTPQSPLGTTPTFVIGERVANT